MSLANKEKPFSGWLWVAVVGLLATGLVSCKRPAATEVEEDESGSGEAVPPDTEAASGSVEEQGYLGPLLGTPWLGHADDGLLVRVEFFRDAKSSTNLCRTRLTGSYDTSASRKTPFTASSELTNITWDGGKGRGSYYPETKTIKATIISASGTHQVLLRQITTETNPELATFRRTIPDDELTQAAHLKFTALLEQGTRWWESGPGWDNIYSTGEIAEGGGNYHALIRPADKKPIALPKLEPGGKIVIPIICHLPPGTALAEDQATVAIVTELHHADDANATWFLNRLNRGAITQGLDAQWIHDKAEPPPVGKVTAYIYLSKARGEGDQQSADTNHPISNLLKVEIEIAGQPAPAE